MKIKKLVLPEVVKRAITLAADNTPHCPYTDYETFRRVIISQTHSIVSEYMPFMVNLKGLDAIHIRGIPIDANLPQTPIDENYKPTLKSTTISETAIIALSSLGYKLMNYQHEKSGAFIHNIYPVPTMSQIQSNAGYMTELEFHNEIAFDENRPDHIMLLCLRQDVTHAAVTKIASIKTALAKLDSKHVKQLQMPHYAVKAPHSFSNQNAVIRLPMIKYDHSGDMKCAFNYNSQITTPLNDNAASALDAFRYAVTQESRDIELQLGDMLIINNRTSVHARTKYSFCDSLNNRWLQRAYITQEVSH